MSGAVLRLAGAAVALALLAGCGSTQLVASALDYRAGVAVIEIDEFDDASPGKPAGQGGVYYNMNSAEGRVAAATAHADGSTDASWFTLAVAHNTALRIADAEDALAARGLPRPVVVAVTSVHPRGIVATGSRHGSTFEERPASLPAPTVRVRGSIRYKVERSVLGALFEGYDELYPYDRFEATADVTIVEPAGEQRHFLAFVAAPEVRNLGLTGFADDPKRQLVARVADMLAPTEMRIQPAGAPLAFVRAVRNAKTVDVDLGLERRTLHVARVLDLGEGAAQPETEDALAALVECRYVRVQFAGGPQAPPRALWRRIEVTEAE